ncbi:MAG: 2-dehydropantoate 2-reductase [Ignavibacteria bacterium]|nr:2-dehydropantoate 2-reductase [Ignavibacteria bacterium]
MDPKKYKIGIVGLGPVGLTLAVHIKEAGCEIAVCDMVKEKMNLIWNSGIELIGVIEKTCFVNYSYSSFEELLKHDIDILICASKAYHVDNILDQIVCHSNNPNLLIISAQNGIGVASKYANRFNESRVLRMVVNFAGNLNAPNVVNVTFFNPPNFIASKDDSRLDIAEWFSEVLSSVNLTTVATDSFTQASKIWEKTILNAALSPLCAISKLTMKEAMSNPDTLEIAEKIIIEAIEVAKAEEIKLSDNFVKLAIRYLKNAGDHFPSLAVDLLNKRETEIDYMNGKLVEYGRKHYVRTPLNLTFTNLVKAITMKNKND